MDKCPKCGDKNCAATVTGSTVWAHLSCLERQLAQRDEQIKALRAAKAKADEAFADWDSENACCSPETMQILRAYHAEEAGDE